MNSPELTEAKILIVCQNDSERRQLRSLLEAAGCGCIGDAADGDGVRALCRALDPDLVLLDLDLPREAGFRILESLEPSASTRSAPPVLALTADARGANRSRALALGVRDFVPRPLDGVDVVRRAVTLIEMSFLYRRLWGQGIPQRIEHFEGAAESDSEHAGLLDLLALAAEYREDPSGGHARRVGKLAAFLAESLGLPPDQIRSLGTAAPLHDVGKIAVPDSIILKPEKLTAAEFQSLKLHTTLGSQMLAGRGGSVLDLASEIALTHHEYWDGSGYPQGLQGKSIPLSGRIVAVADVLDAMTDDRPYRKALPAETARAWIEERSGRQFDPEVVGCLLEAIEGGRLQIRSGATRKRADVGVCTA